MTCGESLGEPESPEHFRKIVTILFSDVVSSTALGEQLDPETLSEIMRAYFESMRVVVERHEGTVAKFLGDAVMAVFGIPELHEDDALRGVRAAAEMRDALVDLNERSAERWGVAISTRTGINTGVVAGVGVVPDQTSSPATPRTSRRASRSSRRATRSCSERLRTGWSAAPSRPELLRPSSSRARRRRSTVTDSCVSSRRSSRSRAGSGLALVGRKDELESCSGRSSAPSRNGACRW